MVPSLLIPIFFFKYVALGNENEMPTFKISLCKSLATRAHRSFKSLATRAHRSCKSLATRAHRSL